jgi:integrase
MAKPIKHGSKWRIRWFDEDGRRRSKVFDTYREAELAAARVQVETDEARRGLRPRTSAAELVFQDLADRWEEHRAAHKRSGRSDLSIIRRHLLPRFSMKPLCEVGVAEADALKSQLLRTHSPKTVHNILTLLRAMLNYAVDLGWLAKVPRIRKPKLTHSMDGYRWLKTNGEIRRLLRAAQLEGDELHALYATAIYTGMRAGELAGLRWTCINLERRLITVRASYEGPTKSGESRYVPIVDPLLPILRAQRLRVPGRLVFTNAAGNMHQASARVFQEVLHRVLQTGGFPETTDKANRRRRYITFHSLRHTFASHWMMNGGDIFRLQRVGGWKSFEMVQRYAHLAPHAFEQDWGRFGSADASAEGPTLLGFSSGS